MKRLINLVTSFVLLSLLFMQTSSSVFAQSVKVEGPPLGVEILGTSYNTNKRITTTDISIVNNTNEFVDNLKYRLEFYYGDKLGETGYIFSEVEFIVSTDGDIERLSPNEKKKQVINYTLPSTLSGGNYFLRLIVFNDDNSYYGINYTKQPIKLTGTGGFIPYIDAALISPEDGLPHRLMEGPNLDPSTTPTLAILKKRNPVLFERLEKEELYVSYEITHISDPDVVVNSMERTPLGLMYRVDGEGLEIKFKPWEGIKAGANTAVVSFSNSKGEKIAESLLVRLLYNGLLGRIYEANTSINSYRRGEPLDLEVNVVVAGDVVAKKVILEATFYGKNEKTQLVAKDILLNNTLEGIDVVVDFLDEKAKRSMVVERVDVVLKDSDGNQLDQHVITLDTDKIFAYPREFPSFKVILFSLLIFIVIVASAGFIHKKTKIKTKSVTGALVIALIFIGGAFMYSNSIPTLVFASEYGCTDSVASNYDSSSIYDDGSCIYEDQYYYGCTDASASNYDPSANTDNGSCTYSTYGCTDSSASNYDPSANYDDGSCYYYVSGCMDVSANNYNSSATSDDGSCTYDYDSDVYGCTDEDANNFNPDATIDDDSCTYNPVVPPNPRLYGDLLSLWSNPSGDPDGYQGVCTEGCISMEYYMKLQCKQCANQGINTEINFFNAWNHGMGDFNNPINPHDQQIVVSTELDSQYLSDYGYYTVQSDSKDHLFAQEDGNIAKAPEGSLSGTPVNAHDIINWWIYGPFIFDFCWVSVEDRFVEEEASDRDALIEVQARIEELDQYIQDYETQYPGQIAEELRAERDQVQEIEQFLLGEIAFFDFFEGEAPQTRYESAPGQLEQPYNVQARTLFGGDYCQLSYEGDTDYVGPVVVGILDSTRNLYCDFPGTLESTFFLDENENGVFDTGESFIKDSNAQETCPGIKGNALGRIRGFDNNVDFSRLTSDNCREDDSRPYFFKDGLGPGVYIPSLDPASIVGGWKQTVLLLETGSLERIEVEDVTVDRDATTTALIGIKNEFPVAFSCFADPEQDPTFPSTIDWNTDNYYSDTYNIEDLTFVWSGDTGVSNSTSKSGGANGGRFTTTYNSQTGGEGEYTVFVHAENSTGDTVSNSASCTVKAGVECPCDAGYQCISNRCYSTLKSSCGGYTSPTAQYPKLFFGPGENVYWKATVSGGSTPYEYDWTGAADEEDESIAGPYSVGPSGDYQYVSGPVYTAGLVVQDNASVYSNASCSIRVKECNNDNDCPITEDICRLDDFTCGPPKPIFIEALSIDPGVINEGQQCSLGWNVDNAYVCKLFKNGVEIDSNAPSDTTLNGGYLVDPGSYNVHCENEIGEALDAGPARCLLNPEIKEQ